MLEGEKSEELLEKNIRGYHLPADEVFYDDDFTVEEISEQRRKEKENFEKDPSQSDPHELKANPLTKGDIKYEFDLATFVDQKQNATCNFFAEGK